MNGPAAPAFRRHAIALVALVGIHFTAPWPGLQAMFHVFLVLGLAPGFPSLLQGLLWSALAGWVLEGSLRVYPHLGGTALGNMVATMLVYWLLLQWPPHSRKPYWGRQAAMVLIHAILVHTTVRIAAGPHTWGFGWLWALVTIPLWASLALRLHPPIHRR